MQFTSNGTCYSTLQQAMLESESSNPGQAIVIMNVQDVNEPPVFVSSHYVTSIPEGIPVGSQVSVGILAVDSDEVFHIM